MAVVVRIQMKLAILRHSARGERSTWEITFVMLGIVLAAATVADPAYGCAFSDAAAFAAGTGTGPSPRTAAAICR